MENSRSRSPRRKHRSRRSHSHSKSRREGRRRSISKEDKHKHKKAERTYESPFVLTDIYYSSTLAGAGLSKIIKKEYPKMADLDDSRISKKKNTNNEGSLTFYTPQAEEACKKILRSLENK